MSSLEVPSYFFHECESAIKVRGNNTSKGHEIITRAKRERGGKREEERGRKTFGE